MPIYASVVIGIAAGVVCYYAIQLKNRLNWDDALDVWGVHGVVAVPTLVVQGARDPFGIPPAGERRTVVQVQSDHSLRSDLGAVGEAVRAWLGGLVIPAG